MKPLIALHYYLPANWTGRWVCGDRCTLRPETHGFGDSPQQAWADWNTKQTRAWLNRPMSSVWARIGAAL